MNKIQTYIVTSWIVATATLFLALYIEDGVSIPVLFVGFAICRYLRRDFDAESGRLFQTMGERLKAISAIYYVIVAGVTFSLVIFNPVAITYSDGQFLLLIIIFLPLLPEIIWRDAYLYAQASENDALN